MNRDYELGFILNPEVNEEQTRSILERIDQIVSNYGGQVVRVNQWGRKRLAYQIEHNRDGFYVFIDMILTPETVNELDRNLKVSEEVLRHLIIRRDPKAVQKERDARAAAAAQAQAQPVAEVNPEGQLETPADEENEDESENQPLLTDEENDYVPPAIEEEETIEA